MKMKTIVRTLIAVLAVSLLPASSLGQRNSRLNKQYRKALTLIQSGKFAPGWKKLTALRKKHSTNRGIKFAHESMAYYILKKVLVRESVPRGIKVLDLIVALRPYTKNDFIKDPYIVKARSKGRAIILDQVPGGIPLREALLATKYKSRVTPRSAKKLSATKHRRKPVLQRELGRKRYYSNFYWFSGKPNALRGFKKLSGVLSRLKTNYPVVLEIYLVPKEHRSRSDQVIIATVAMENLNDFLKTALKGLKLDIGQNGRDHYSGRGTELHRRIYKYETGATFRPK